MSDEREHIEYLERDFDSMHKMLQQLCAVNSSIREHRDRLWRENIQLRSQLAEICKHTDPAWKYDCGTVNTQERLDQAANVTGGQNDPQDRAVH